MIGNCRQSLNVMLVRNINVVTSLRTTKEKTRYFVNYDVNYYAFRHLRHFNRIIHLGHSNRLLHDVMKEIKKRVQPLTVKEAPVLAGVCTHAFMKTSNVIVQILLTILIGRGRVLSHCTSEIT